MGSLRNAVALLVLAIVGALPLVTGPTGCGRTACFEYTQAEYALNGNSCPAGKDALANFTSASCPGPVVAVDGAGSFDGQLCCYPVSEDDIVPDCGNGGSSGADTGTIPGGTDFSDTSDQTDTSTAPGCTTCAGALSQGESACSFDAEAESAFSQLSECLEGQCAGPCNLAINGTAPVNSDSNCLSCASTSCSVQLMLCDND